MNLRRKHRSTESAYATIVVFALFALVFTLILTNLQSLNWLKREIQLIEQKQRLYLETQVEIKDTNPALSTVDSVSEEQDSTTTAVPNDETP
jgi:hypothetical protein